MEYVEIGDVIAAVRTFFYLSLSSPFLPYKVAQTSQKRLNFTRTCVLTCGLSRFR